MSLSLFSEKGQTQVVCHTPVAGASIDVMSLNNQPSNSGASQKVDPLSLFQQQSPRHSQQQSPRHSAPVPTPAPAAVPADDGIEIIETNSGDRFEGLIKVLRPYNTTRLMDGLFCLLCRKLICCVGRG